MSVETRTAALPPAPAAPARRHDLLGGLLPVAAIFLGAALISGFTMLREVDPFDEGLVLQAARRVGAGQLPYADFLWAYGPVQPYLLAVVNDVSGVSLLDWRILRTLADAGVAAAVFALVRRETDWRWAVAAALVAACAMAQPRSANPFPYALLPVLLAFFVATGGRPGATRRAAAGALIGLAAGFRLDFALYGGAAVGGALLLRPTGRASGRWRPAAVTTGVALAVGLAFYGPFLVAIGPADLYDALVGTSLREADYWTLPFPLLYDGQFRGWPPAALLEDLKDVLDFYVPLLLAIGGALAVLAIAIRARGDGRAAWLPAGFLLLAGGALMYMLSRTDEFHTQPLDVALAVLLPIGAVGLLSATAGGRGRGRRALAGAMGVLLAVLALQGVANRTSALALPPELDPVPVEVADGVKAPPEDAAALGRVVDVVQSRVPPGAPIYVLPQRSDLVRFSNPLIYVLTERTNPTPRDFGLLTSASAQEEIIAALEAARPDVLVRWNDTLSFQPEPNLRGRSSGARPLDAYVAARYRLLERVGDYDLLVPG